MSISTFMRLFTSMKAVKDMFLVFTPEIAILMPISSFLLRIFQSAVELNVTNSGNLFVFFVLIVKTKEFRQFDDLIPDSFGKLNDLFLIKIDIFDADTTVVVKGAHNFFFICDEIIDFGWSECEGKANLSFLELFVDHWDFDESWWIVEIWIIY